jgi:hypothetical protein
VASLYKPSSDIGRNDYVELVKAGGCCCFEFTHFLDIVVDMLLEFSVHTISSVAYGWFIQAFPGINHTETDM